METAQDSSLTEGAHSVVIFINTRKVTTDAKTLNYEQVVKLADVDPNKVYTVMYRDAEGGKEGFLVAGGPSVKVKEGMIFDVDPTTES